MPKAGPQLIEPIMKVDVFSPEDNVGDVIGDLNRRRGMIKDHEPSSTGIRVKADVPLSEMFGCQHWGGSYRGTVLSMCSQCRCL